VRGPGGDGQVAHYDGDLIRREQGCRTRGTSIRLSSEELVKLVIETSRPAAQVAREHAINEGTLTNWVNKYRHEHADDEPDLTVHERARLRELERTNRELAMEVSFLKKAAQYFAQTGQ
jgi:transposase